MPITGVKHLPGGVSSANEELGTVGVGSSVGHGQSAQAPMLQGEVLISKLVAIDGLATSSVVVGEITTLKIKNYKSDENQ